MYQHESRLRNIFIGIINGLKSSMRLSIKEHDLPISTLHFIMLKNINDLEHCTPHALVEATQRDKGQITRLLKEIESIGLVSKYSNPEDKRSQLIQLTSAGEECYKLLEQEDHETLQTMCHGISEKELQTFLAVGEKMLVNLKNSQI